jgi:LacI family transcriptional regulator
MQPRPSTSSASSILKKPSQRTIAQQAGVSFATVSRVLSNSPRVSEHTRQRVLKIVHDMGHGTRPKYMVGLIIPDAKNPYFTDLAFAFSEELAKRSGAAVVMSSDGLLARELVTIEYMKSMNLDAIVFVPASDGSDAVVRLASDVNTPLLVLDREPSVGFVDFIASEYATPIRVAIDYLRAYGHTEIGCLCGPLETHTGRDRRDAFVEAMELNNLPVLDQFFYPGRYDLISGRQCAETLLASEDAKLPTAIFACNDLMAIGLMQRLQEAGWRLPERLSVIGFDNIEWSDWTYPTLSTIGQKVSYLAREAVERIVVRINEREQATRVDLLVREPVRRTLPADFIPRASVTGPWVGHGIRGVVQFGASS